jgi:hypothetical protein
VSQDLAQRFGTLMVETYVAQAQRNGFADRCKVQRIGSAGGRLGCRHRGMLKRLYCRLRTPYKGSSKGLRQEASTEALFLLAERATDGSGLGAPDGSFNPGGRQLSPFVRTLGPSIPEGRLPLGEAPNDRQDGCHGVAERSHFNKIFASLNANYLLQGKDRKNGRLRPSKLCSGPVRAGLSTA